MSSLKQSSQKKSTKLFIYLGLDVMFLVLSISIPLILVGRNQTGSCLHHIEDSEGSGWIIGRALGFSTFIWFIITTFYGTRTKKLARAFKSYQKARDFHCLNALINTTLLMVHIISLLSSDPWSELIFDREFNHLPFPLFIIKLSTGIVFGVFMLSVSLSAIIFRDMKRMKRFGFKNFIKIHYFMLSLSFLLAIHIFLINTEILVMFWG
jgi:hypothetical protein